MAMAKQGMQDQLSSQPLQLCGQDMKHETEANISLRLDQLLGFGSLS